MAQTEGGDCPVYADYNGSAPLCPEVVEYLKKRLEDGPYANPNAIHHLGQKCLLGMENARGFVAKKLGAKRSQLIFNSGATEGINAIFFSVLEDAKDQGREHIIISSIEHSAVLNCGKYYASKGYKLHLVEVDENGVLKVDHLKALLEEFRGKVALVSIMAANNETGVVQPVEEIVSLCRSNDALFFSDTTQYIGKVAEFNFKELDLDFAVTSGHKIGAMTGTGLILAKDPTMLKEFVIGGGQEKGLRGGTQNYLGYETLAVALDAFDKKKEKLGLLREKRDDFEKKVTGKFPGAVILGKDAERVASTTYIALPGVHGQAVQIELESQNIFVTTSSACSDNMPVTSRVLKSMGVSDDIGRGVVRISLGTCSPLEFYDRVYDALIKAYEKLSEIKSF